MKSTKTSEMAKDLSPMEAIVLQQVHEDGEDDAHSLATGLGMSRQRILSIVARLKRRGLVSVNGGYDAILVNLTSKGRRLINYLWPKQGMLYS
ncbi:MAG: MarR family transcriptional regulator [Bacteroidia bacterium]|nr:MarR family transcriptional regulator [Bacteroidia bacterium]